jgi:imidazole glycerol-phosphate synthase subunit HisH
VTCVIVDYGSGNLHSAGKAFARVAAETGGGPVLVSGDPGQVARAERLVLPGVGAFADCRAGLMAVPGLFAAVTEAAIARARPFLGICVGMQMMAMRGLEHGETPGFGWIAGEVAPLAPAGTGLKIPHMGWNALAPARPHPLWDGIAPGGHAYFVHSFALRAADPADVAATADHGGAFVAAVARENLFGTQFHPEKSQALGLRLIANFLRWTPQGRIGAA